MPPEQAFAQACVAAQLAEGVSTLVANPVADVPVIARPQRRHAAGAATYHYDASFGKPDRDARPKLKKIVQIVERRMPPRPRRACAKAPPSPTACR